MSADGIATFLEEFILAPESFTKSYICDASAFWVNNGQRKLKMEPIPKTKRRGATHRGNEIRRF